ncbi:MAG: zinc-binding alcohol dehydrogenase [Pseudomonadota bacterium]
MVQDDAEKDHPRDATAPGRLASDLGEGKDKAASAPNAALTYVGPGQIAIEPSPPPDAPGPHEARVRTLYSAFSRGTERLVLGGRVPRSEHQRMRAPRQRGAFPFPVVYGYAAVGEVEEGPPDWIGRRVFALHPHERAFTAPLSALTPLPERADPRRATLAANMETALNGLWDGGVGPGDRVAVVGGGVLGMLVAGVASGVPGVECVIVDPQPGRASAAAALGVAHRADWADPAEAASAAFEADLVAHTSATEAGLRAALALAGAEATVLELSWYGDQAPAAPLGAAFHSRRLRLISSQVGAVASSRRARWSHGRRLAKAVELLSDSRYDALVTDEIAFEDAPVKAPTLLRERGPGLAAVLRY